MEQTAEPGTVQIADDTYQLVTNLFDFDVLGGIDVKGKVQPVPSYRVLNPQAASGKARGIEGLDAPLVGRSGEWKRLEDVVANLQRGIGGIVGLVGEAGLGKSRLIQELHNSVDQSQTKIAWHETASLSYESERPYALFQRLVRRMVGAGVSDSAEALREKLEAITGAVADEEQAAVLLVFTSLFGLEGTADTPLLEGETFKGRLFTVMKELGQQQAAQHPVVLVFDDLHWSDSASVALLLHLLPLCEQCPLLILWAMRPERQAPGWQVKQLAETEYGHRFTEIALQPLTLANSGKLVDSLLTLSDLPVELKARILEKTEGNPFFVEEVVRTLIESGIVVREGTGRHWLATGIGEAIDIPGNVQTLLTARIDRLDVDVRQTLHIASVVGRSFYYRVLARITQMASMLDEQLLTLERVELIREETRIPELEYLFRHALTQEAAYSTILLKERRIYHRRVAEALQGLFAERREELSGNIADHYYAAQLYEKALDYYLMAGDEAFRLYASAEATEQYRKALTCAGKVGTSSERLIHLYIRRGRALELSSRFDDALENYKEMIEIAAESGDRALELASLTAQSIVRATLTPLNDSQLSRELAEKALALAQELGDRAAEAKVLWGLLIIEQWGGGDIQQGVAYGQRSLAIARELDLQEQMGYALTNLGTANFALGNLEQAYEFITEAQSIWLALGNTPMLIDAHGFTSIIYWAAGRFEDSVLEARERHTISKSIGNEWNLLGGLSLLAMDHYEMGEFGRAIEYIEEGLIIIEETGLFNIGHYLRTTQVLTYVASGAWQDAQEIAESVYADREQVTLLIRPVVLAALAHAQIGQGEFENAERILNEGLKAADYETMSAIYAVPPKIAQAHLLLATNNPELALESVNEVIGRLNQTDMRMQLPESYWLKGKALDALGKSDEARDALMEGKRLAQEMNAQRILWQILGALADIEERQGKTAVAVELRDQAKDIITYIADNAGSEELRDSFLSLETVQSVI